MPRNGHSGTQSIPAVRGLQVCQIYPKALMVSWRVSISILSQAIGSATGPEAVGRIASCGLILLFQPGDRMEPVQVRPARSQENIMFTILIFLLSLGIPSAVLMAVGIRLVRNRLDESPATVGSILGIALIVLSSLILAYLFYTTAMLALGGVVPITTEEVIKVVG